MKYYGSPEAKLDVAIVANENLEKISFGAMMLQYLHVTFPKMILLLYPQEILKGAHPSRVWLNLGSHPASQRIEQEPNYAVPRSVHARNVVSAKTMKTRWDHIISMVRKLYTLFLR